MTKLTSPQDMVVWNRLVHNHEAFAFASTDFLTGDIDRVAVIHSALQGRGKQTAFYMLRSLNQSDLQGLFEDLVFHASYAHGALMAVRDSILALPRDWVLARIEAVAESLLANGTYDEYRRLLELYALLDPMLTQRLAERAIQHLDLDVQEAGHDFLK